MDYRYIKYINKGYYYSIPTEADQGLLNIDDPPDNYVLIDGEHWINVLVKNQKLPNQGWKIHISTNIEDI